MADDRVVALVAEVAWGQPARKIIENLPVEHEARTHAYGGTRRRIYVTVNSTDAPSAAATASQLVKRALGDFLDADAEVYVDEVTLKIPIDSVWETL